VPGFVNEPVEEAIRTAPLFRRLSPEDRARVAGGSRLERYGKSEAIFHEGDPADRFYLLTSGRVKVFKTTAAGRTTILEIFGPGDPLGAVAVYEGWPFPASAVALEDTEALTMPRSMFFELLERHPSLARGVLLGLTHRLVELTNRLAALSSGRVDSRVARLFLKLAAQVGREEPGGVFVPITLTRQELADLTGTTIETAIRIMSRWQQAEILLTRKDGFLVVDGAALEALAEL
jgi:CRP-like cAMP-binding protein